MMRGVWFLAWCVLGVLGMAPAASAGEMIFNLDWVIFGRHTPYYVALEKGYFAEYNLDVKITPVASGNTILQGQIAGEFESADTSPVLMFPAVEKGAGFKIIGSPG